MTIKELKITDIKANPDLMMRATLNKSIVAQYKETIETILQIAPITVYQVGSEFVLTDGFHRLSAARQAELETVNAQVFTGTFQDAYAAACLANLQHGQPLTRDERKNAICEYIKVKVDYSNPVIAQATGVNQSTIHRYRKELESRGEIKSIEARIGQDGKEQVAQQNKSGFAIANPETEQPQEPEPDPYQEWFDMRVIQGDALEMLPTLERKFDLAIVDPPYGITTEKWDLTNKHELLAFTRRWLNSLLGLLKPTARLYIFWSREYMFDLKPLLDEIQETYPLHFGGMLVWYFRNVQSQPDNRKRYKLGWEPIFYYYGLSAQELNFPATEITGESWEGKGDVQSDVWTFSIPQSNYQKDKRIHPTQKPRELYERIIETASHVNDSIIDPFAGSGTALHAAELTGRNALLIEQNSEYIDKIHARLRPVWEKNNNDRS